MIITRVLAKYQTSLQNHNSRTKKMYTTKFEREAHVRTVGKSRLVQEGRIHKLPGHPNHPRRRLAPLVKETLELQEAPGLK